MRKLKILPMDWDGLIFSVFMIWLFIYLLSGQNIFEALYEVITDFQSYTSIAYITIIVIVAVVFGSNRLMYNEIEGWASYYSLTINKIEAKNLFSDGQFFKNYSRRQFYINVKSKSGEKGTVLFQFGFRNPTNPNKIWLTDALKDSNNKVISDDVS